MINGNLSPFISYQHPAVFILVMYLECFVVPNPTDTPIYLILSAGSLHGITHRLLSLHQPCLEMVANLPKFETRATFTEEAPALAYIIVALKLLLGLDDDKEVRMSEVGRELRSKLPGGKFCRAIPYKDNVYRVVAKCCVSSSSSQLCHSTACYFLFYLVETEL